MTATSGYCHHIEDCTRYDPARFAPFYVDAERLGWASHDVIGLLTGASGMFLRQQDGMTLNQKFDSFSSRSTALREAVTFLAQHYNVKTRKEMYPVLQRWEDTPLAEIDRVAVPWFGVRGFGVHVNGYVRKNDKIHLWIAERAMDRQVDPGKLDNIIGGGQPIGLTIKENLAKEAWEEAGVEASLAAMAQPVGTLSYKVERMRGLRNDTLFLYDLELSEDFKPRNTDGEVGAFHLMPLDEVAAIIRDTDRFKFNCNLVVIDFLLRHGYFKENDKDYGELQKAFQPLKTQSLP